MSHIKGQEDGIITVFLKLEVCAIKLVQRMPQNHSAHVGGRPNTEFMSPEKVSCIRRKATSTEIYNTRLGLSVLETIYYIYPINLPFWS